MTHIATKDSGFNLFNLCGAEYYNICTKNINIFLVTYSDKIKINDTVLGGHNYLLYLTTVAPQEI